MPPLEAECPAAHARQMLDDAPVAVANLPCAHKVQILLPAGAYRAAVHSPHTDAELLDAKRAAGQSLQLLAVWETASWKRPEAHAAHAFCDCTYCPSLHTL